MPTYVMRNGELVEKGGPLDIQEDRGSSAHVISDYQPALKHHGTGRITESKSQFRQMTKATGCIEIGNEIPKPRQPIKLDRRERREAIGRAIYQLKNG